MIKVIELFGDVKFKIHSDGKIETFDHLKPRSNGRPLNVKGKILKPGIDKYGYERVVLTGNGIRKNFTVHRLVAMAFIENPEEKPTVNHIDGNKRNNDYRNLEWATQKEQKRHAIKTGLAEKNVRILKKHNESISIPIIYEGIYYKSINEAARSTGIHGNTIKKRGVMPNEQSY